MIIIGIDPGANGALAFIDEAGRIVTHQTAKVPPIEALCDAFAATGEPSNAVAYLERVGGYIAGAKLPGSSMFKMGHNAGYWEGALAMAQISTILVRPQEWQAGLPNVAGHREKAARKRAIKDEALRRYPTLRVTNDTADAIMIADYGRRQK